MEREQGSDPGGCETSLDIPVKLGVFLLAGQFPGTTESEALTGALEAAVTADEVGLDSVWIAEHHFISYGVCPSAVASAANVLGRTRRVTVGTAVCMLSNRHPLALAAASTMSDASSGSPTLQSATRKQLSRRRSPAHSSTGRSRPVGQGQAVGPLVPAQCPSCCRWAERAATSGSLPGSLSASRLDSCQGSASRS